MLWQEKDGVRKYHLVKWADVCQPRDQGGLGLTNLDVKNTSLLCKWLWRLENEEGTWQNVLKFKYLKKGTLTQDRKYIGCFKQKAKRPGHMYKGQKFKYIGCSQFWSGLMEVKHFFIVAAKEFWEMGVKQGFGKMCGLEKNHCAWSF